MAINPTWPVNGEKPWGNKLRGGLDEIVDEVNAIDASIGEAGGIAAVDADGDVVDAGGNKVITVAAANAAYATKASPAFTGSRPTTNGATLATQQELSTESAKAAKPRAGWATGTAYVVNDIVYQSGIFYYCTSAHTSSTFASDLAAGRWRTLSPRHLDNLTPPRGIGDYLALRENVYPLPIEVEFLASGFSLSSVLGSHTEHTYDSTPPVRVIGMKPDVVGVASTTFQMNVVNGSGPRQPYSLEFLLDVPDIDAGELVLTYRKFTADPPAAVLVEIDGSPTTADMIRLTDGTTSQKLGLHVSGIPAGRHKVKLTLRSIDWRSIAVPDGVTVTETTATRPTMVILGDSWIEGGSDASTHAQWPHAVAPTIAQLLDVDPFYCGQGGTGYVASPGGGKTPFGNANRLDAIEAVAPDYVLVFGSVNDDASHASVGAAASSLFTALATRLPSTKVFVVGPQSTRFDGSGNRRNSITAIKTAAASAPNVVGGTAIDPHNAAWMTGNGTLAAPDGFGISDYAMHADATHPTILGARYYGRRVAEEITALALKAGLVNGASLLLPPTS